MLVSLERLRPDRRGMRAFWASPKRAINTQPSSSHRHTYHHTDTSQQTTDTSQQTTDTSPQTTDTSQQADGSLQPDGSLYLPLNLNYPGLRLVHSSPPMYLIDDFLSEEECNQLIRVAGPMLQRSKTHAAAGSEATKGRTSLTCHLRKSAGPCPTILRKIQLLTNKPYGHMELPQVARYSDGQRYVEHYDGVDPRTSAGRVFCENGGQRVATVLIYLNDVEKGGSTFFPRLKLAVRPVRGAACVFFPGFTNGQLDSAALHAGMPPQGPAGDEVRLPGLGPTVV